MRKLLIKVTLKAICAQLEGKQLFTVQTIKTVMRLR